MDFGITMLRKDTFTSLPNQIFLVGNKDTLHRMTINAKDIKNSEKIKLKAPRFKDRIIDYRQLSLDYIVRLQKDYIILNQIDSSGTMLYVKQI